MTVKEFLEERKGKLAARLEEIRACEDDQKKRVDEIEDENQKEHTEEELKALGDELDLIDAKKAELEAEKAEKEAELAEIEAQLKALDEPKNPDGEEGSHERRKFLQFEKREEERKMTVEERKAKAEEFKKGGHKTITNEEMRAVLVSSGKIATPTEVKGIEPTFNQVSSIVDLVRVEDCEGMGSNKVAYEVAIGTANEQTEGQAITNSDPEYDFVEIQPKSYGILSYVSNQVLKQSPLNYEGKVNDSAEKALKVKAAAVITAAVVGSDLLSTPEDLAITAIDEKTLRKIALNYGSDETVYGDAWLFLNKKDLIAFGDVRSDTTLQAVYEITPDAGNPNTGIIKDGGLAVRYCINSNLPALTGATQGEAAKVCLLYGQPSAIELDLFSNYEIRVSEDYKFAENVLAIRGTVDLGCDIIKKDGIIAVTLPAAE